jgi:hypothetical protein
MVKHGCGVIGNSGDIDNAFTIYSKNKSKR